MNSYVTFHDLWIHIWIHVYEEYREIIPEFGCVKVPDGHWNVWPRMWWGVIGDNEDSSDAPTFSGDIDCEIVDNSSRDEEIDEQLH